MDIKVGQYVRLPNNKFMQLNREVDINSYSYNLKKGDFVIKDNELLFCDRARNNMGIVIDKAVDTPQELINGNDMLIVKDFLHPLIAQHTDYRFLDVIAIYTPNADKSVYTLQYSEGEGNNE